MTGLIEICDKDDGTDETVGQTDVDLNAWAKKSISRDFFAERNSPLIISGVCGYNAPAFLLLVVDQADAQAESANTVFKASTIRPPGKKNQNPILLKHLSGDRHFQRRKWLPIIFVREVFLLMSDWLVGCQLGAGT